MNPLVERIVDLSDIEIDYLKQVHNYDIRESTMLVELPNVFETGAQFKDAATSWYRDTSARVNSALDTQVGGDHYKNFVIEPLEYIMKNNLSFDQGAVIKYVSRYKFKNGIEDLQKARHIIDYMIELEAEKEAKLLSSSTK